jgi:hypothetical protein
MIKGQVKLKTKGSAADPKKGKLSVEISPGGGSDEIEIGSSSAIDSGDAADVGTDDLDAVTQKRSGIKASTGKVEPIGDKQSLGRARRQR